MRHLWLAGLALVLILLGLWLGPYALALYHLEAGGRALEESLVTVFPDRLAPEQVTDAKKLEAGAARLQAALRWDPRDVPARRLLARAYLSQGQPEAALEILQSALAARPTNPLLSLELGDVYDSLGQTEEAIKAYEAGRVGSRRTPLTANYLKLAEAHAEEGGGDTAIALWRRALTTDPGNLYTLYRLAKAHRAMGDVKNARVYEKQLQHFEPQSVAIPLDFRLAEYQGRAMAALVDGGLWERATLCNVVSGQVKQFADGVPGLMTERVLQTLLEWSVAARSCIRYDNRLMNASFDYVNMVGERAEFPAWTAATFGKQPQAQGWRKSVPGNGSPGALELGLTDAADGNYRVGAQQSCGAALAPGTQLELQADIWIPQNLQGAYAWVGTVIYDPAGKGKTAFVGISQKAATSGWKRQTVAGQVPYEAEQYSCMFLVVLDSLQPLTSVANVARFDNIVLQ